MIQAIHTAVPGRVRYKVEGLYHSEALKKLIELRLGEQRGIRSVSANPLTGNVLISFNSHNTPASLVRRLEKIVKEYRRQSLDSVEVDLGTRRIRKRLSTAQSQKLSPHTGDRQLAQSPTQRQYSQGISKDQPVKSWHLMSAQEVLASLKTNRAKGLSPQTVQRHLRTYGPNVLPEAEARSDLEILWEQINSLPVGLLTAAAGFSLLTGGLVDAIAIMGVVSINAVIGYVTESQSEKTIHSLKNLVRPSALVIRNSRPTEVSAEEVVIGDILILKPGSYVPADSRLLEAHHLSVDQSALTGESLPVSKIVDPLTILDLPLADRVNMVYMGTLVTGGQGLAVVTATGRFTEIGTIQMLADGAQSPQTPMERQLDQMGSQLVYLSSAVCGVVFGIGVLHGYGWLEMFIASISLAVAAVPEGLPTVAVTTLALGIRNMRRHKVLIRHLDAVEALGSMETICLDKTGTLTLNQMKVTAAYTGMQRVQIADESFHIRGYEGEHTIEPLSHAELVKMAQVCVLCSESEIEQQADNYMLKGSPTENALIYMAINAGVDVTALRKQLPMLRVDLRSENRNFMRTLHRVTPPYQHGTPETTPAPLFVGVKGSPAEVLEQCTWQLKDGQRLPLTDEDRGAIETENERMAGEALRVLGVAYTEHAHGHTPPASETDLTWLGLVGMVDPIRDGVKAVVGGFHQAGINTIMITGDQSPTAYAIGRELDISNQDHLEILDSTHIANVDPAVLTALSEKVHVFSRVSPAHKLQIVQALQRAGKVVAMTGDGINDGPALKAADIGIAMGHTGTDVAREVADVVLEDDNLETMIVAVSQGRTIYRNIRKSVRFLLATNLSEIVVMSAAIAGGLGHPLNTLQLLWINLVSDIFPGLALAVEPPEPDVLEQPPRDPEEPIIQTADFKRLGFEAAMLSAGALGAYGYGLMRYGAGVQAGTLAFTSLTTGQLLNAVTARSETESVFSAPDRPSNPYLNAAVFGSLGLQALTLAVPGLRSLLGLAPIGLLDGLVIGSSVAIPFVINEQTKQPIDQQTDEEDI